MKIELPQALNKRWRRFGYHAQRSSSAAATAAGLKNTFSELAQSCIFFSLFFSVSFHWLCYFTRAREREVKRVKLIHWTVARCFFTRTWRTECTLPFNCFRTRVCGRLSWIRAAAAQRSDTAYGTFEIEELNVLSTING